MILSNRELQNAIDSGRLVIEPEPRPREPAVGDIHCPYDTHSVDLKLGNEIIVPKEGTFDINLSNPGSLSEFISQHSKRYTLGDKQSYRLEQGEFILARTSERIELPLDKGLPCLSARIEGKGSRARCGLLVHFTAPTIHPGFKGRDSYES